MQCKSCGKEVKSDFKYCPYCSQRLMQAFEDHYGELTPPLILDQEEDPASILYGNELSEEIYILPEDRDIKQEAPYTQQEIAAPVNQEQPYYIYHPEIPSDPSPEGYAPEEDDDPLFDGLEAEPFIDPADPPESLLEQWQDGEEEDLQADLPYEEQENDCISMEEEELPPFEELEPDREPAVMDDGRVSSARYVSMKPEVGAEHTPAVPDEENGTAAPGLAFKILLILFLVLFASLLSFVVYRFFCMPDPLKNFSFASLFASVMHFR